MPDARCQMQDPGYIGDRQIVGMGMGTDMDMDEEVMIDTTDAQMKEKGRIGIEAAYIPSWGLRSVLYHHRPHLHQSIKGVAPNLLADIHVEDLNVERTIQLQPLA